MISHRGGDNAYADRKSRGSSVEIILLVIPRRADDGGSRVGRGKPFRGVKFNFLAGTRGAQSSGSKGTPLSRASAETPRDFYL